VGSASRPTAEPGASDETEGVVTIDGYLDSVTEDGRVLGWACRPGHVARLHVGIFLGERLVAAAVTQGYRPDLLAAGHGLGHCAFAARLREDLPPGPAEFGLRLLDTPSMMPRFTIPVPPIRRPATVVINGPGPRWTDADITQNLHRLHLAAQFAALGPERFVDGACQFVLGRWAEPPLIAAVRRDAAAGDFRAEDFVRGLIESDERRARADEALPSPFDARFPFCYPWTPAAS